jgi:hypothetical protein
MLRFFGRLSGGWLVAKVLERENRRVKQLRGGRQQEAAGVDPSEAGPAPPTSPVSNACASWTARTPSATVKLVALTAVGDAENDARALAPASPPAAPAPAPAPAPPPPAVWLAGRTRTLKGTQELRVGWDAGAGGGRCGVVR